MKSPVVKGPCSLPFFKGRPIVKESLTHIHVEMLSFDYYLIAVRFYCMLVNYMISSNWLL